MPKKFRKRFRCGRAVLLSDGTVKKLNLSEGGGSRHSNWYHSYMNFESVRNDLIKMYHLDDVECETSLYDYRLQPLNQDKYPTVWKYVRDNGLNCNSTIIYLCTREMKTSKSSKRKVKKRRKKDSMTELNPSSSSIVEKHSIKTEVESHSKQTSLSLNEHSYLNRTEDLVKYLRDLVYKNTNDRTLSQLFENVCVLHGYALATGQLRNVFNQSENDIYLNNLKDIQKICESINDVLSLDRERLNTLEHFPVFHDLFTSFHQNVKNPSYQQIDDFKIKTEPDVPSSSGLFE